MTLGRAGPTPVLVRIAPPLLLALFVALGASAMHGKSPTFDETAHLPAGYWYWKSGRFDLYSNNPPLSKLLAAAPLLALRPALPAPEANDHWRYAVQFQRENARRYHTIFFAGRVPILLLGALLGLGVWAWTRRTFGEDAGLAALVLFTFSPNLLAHATVVTPDLALAAFFFATLLAAHRSIERPSLAWFAAAGAALGLALLAKFTALLLLPLLAVFLPLVPAGRRAGGAAVVCGMALLTVNAGYAFRDVFYPFGGMVFQTELFRSMPAGLRLPLPADWIQGLDVQLADNRAGAPAYLLGRTYPDGGPWYYELAAVALKTTVPLLVLAVFGFVALVRERRRWALVLLAPVLLLLAAVSLVVHLEIGVRYVLPIYPFLIVAGGVGAARLARGGSAMRAATAVLLVWHAVTSLAAYPNYLAYTNELTGRGRNGYRFLVDSNLDWGQDLPALAKFMRERGIAEVGLSYFGLVEPSLYGIRYHLIPEGPLPPGWYAVSATHLAGVYDPRTSPLQTAFQERRDLDVFRSMEPVAVPGNSILVYRVDQMGEGEALVPRVPPTGHTAITLTSPP